MNEKIKQRQDEIIEMVSSFCDEYLNEEYEELSIKLVQKMAQKEKVPFKQGKLEIWASAVIYRIAQVNELFNKTSDYHISASDICNHFNTKKSTVSGKAALIDSLFHSDVFDTEFSLNGNVKLTGSIVEENMDEFFDEVYNLYSEDKIDEALSKLDLIDEDSPEYGRALFYKSMIISSDDPADSADLLLDALMHEYAASEGKGIEKTVDDDVDIDNLLYELKDINQSFDHYDSGVRYFNEGDFENALNSFDAALESNPNECEIIYYKALTLAMLDEFDIALELMDKAISINSEEDRFWNDKANFLSRLGRFDEAEECFDEAIRLNPTDSVLWCNKGFLYIQTGKYEKAIESYNKSRILEGDTVHNLVGISNAYVELVDYVNAEKYLIKASEIDDKDDEYLSAMAHFRLEEERLEESIEYWDKILELDPERADVYMYKAMTYLMMNNHPKAEECMEKGLEIDPDIVDAFQDFILEELENKL